MRRCIVCGAENPGDARFCVDCGSSMAALCDRCGAELPTGVRFCPACGASVVPLAAPREERKLVTVLFADVVGSTALGSRLDPERLREVTDAYFDAMRDELESQGGTVEKFIGDAVMAVFGVPAAHEDDPTRAVRAALDLVGAVAADDLTIRVGIETGEVVVGPSGSAADVATGPVVAAAARLRDAAEPGVVLLGPAAQGLVQGAVIVGPARAHAGLAAREAIRIVDGASALGR
ncbi:MAG TPA: adenylate/guanylate cyclase domain-containing protein, partial [Actinomycetota bacterium]|nr:adenylate/guanylate cyclase domain-containing protein [Actinomycetota bacterium]